MTTRTLEAVAAARYWLTDLGWAATTTPPVTACTFPTCIRPATTINRAGQDVCAGHERVVVGGYVPDRHDETEGEQE